MAITSLIQKTLSSPLFMGIFIILISVASLASAYTAQYVFGLQPCVLCLYQRVPFALAILWGVMSLIMTKTERRKAASFMIFLAAVTFLAGSVIAFYHNGVEQHWWASFLEGCKISFDVSGDDFLSRIEQAQAVRCDEIPWADPVIGWSMAAWNIIMSGGLFLTCLFSSIFIIRKENGL